jgi:hypothetical protein
MVWNGEKVNQNFLSFFLPPLSYRCAKNLKWCQWGLSGVSSMADPAVRTHINASGKFYL